MTILLNNQIKEYESSWIKYELEEAEVQIKLAESIL